MGPASTLLSMEIYPIWNDTAENTPTIIPQKRFYEL
jgi:hypothetical protein